MTGICSAKYASRTKPHNAYSFFFFFFFFFTFFLSSASSSGFLLLLLSFWFFYFIFILFFISIILLFYSWVFGRFVYGEWVVLCESGVIVQLLIINKRMNNTRVRHVSLRRSIDHIGALV